MITKFKNNLIITATIFFTGLIFYLILTKINFIGTLEAIRTVKIKYLLLCISISTLVNIFMYTDIRRVIWRNIQHTLDYKELLFIRLGSLPFKVIPSFKNTDIVSAIYIKKFHNIPITEGILTNVIANIFDLISILLMFAAGYLFSLIYHIDLSYYQHYFTIIFIISILLIAFLYSFLLNQNIGKNILAFFFLGKKSKHLDLLTKNMSMWKDLPGSKNMFLLSYSFIFQLSELIIFYIFSKSFGLQIPFTKILLYIPLIIIISQLPISFSGLGVKEGAYVLFFLNFATNEVILAIGLMTFFVNQVIPIFIGSIFTIPFLHKLQFSEIKNNIDMNLKTL